MSTFNFIIYQIYNPLPIFHPKILFPVATFLSLSFMSQPVIEREVQRSMRSVLSGFQRPPARDQWFYHKQPANMTGLINKHWVQQGVSMFSLNMTAQHIHPQSLMISALIQTYPQHNHPLLCVTSSNIQVRDLSFIVMCGNCKQKAWWWLHVTQPVSRRQNQSAGLSTLHECYWTWQTSYPIMQSDCLQ